MNNFNTTKKIITRYNGMRYRDFTLDNASELLLPSISFVPWISVSKRQDTYSKTVIALSSNHSLKFISKNNQPYAFLWQTNALQLKMGVRWGIIKTHSITSQVIATVGRYRLVSHGRIAQGMISNSQPIKLKLLDLFQDRFEALCTIESLVNKKIDHVACTQVLDAYMQRLGAIKANLENYFTDVNLSGLDETTFAQIKDDLDEDISRTQSYLEELNSSEDLSPYLIARGTHSLMEFVKQQMLNGLYELQGINQDMTYSSQRYFALTRGELNNFIEDARKQIDDHQADLCDAVTEKHHGIFSSDHEKLLNYDFSEDELTPAQQREILLAISFIEGCDKLTTHINQVSVVHNNLGEEALVTIAATQWRSHHNLRALWNSIQYFILNMFKGFFFETYPWEEVPWQNVGKGFTLFATELRKYVRPNEPLWYKPFKFFRQIGNAFIDIFQGISNLGSSLVINMPADLINDWESTKDPLHLAQVLQELEGEITQIKQIEQQQLDTILRACDFSVAPITTLHEEPVNPLAVVEYPLSAGEQNDILTATIRGLNDFFSVFFHGIYAKDPVGGVLFSAAYALGVATLYYPELVSSALGGPYVNQVTNFSYLMTASRPAAAIAAASTQAEILAIGWDSLMHGPKGNAMHTLYRLGEDPMTYAAYVIAAYGLGYALSNGIAGYKVPWLSERLQGDLGKYPKTRYPLLGGKAAVVSYKALLTKRPTAEPLISPVIPLNNLRKTHEKFYLATWLILNTRDLPKLSAKDLFRLSQQINLHFNHEESKSLQHLLYPPKQRSIAFQILSPLSYIAAIIRLTLSLLLSIAAFVLGKLHPLEPGKRAFVHLFEKIKVDLAKFIVFTAHLIYLPYTIFSSLIKTTVFLAIMSVGRIAGLFNAKPAHAIHKLIAKVHVFCRNVSEFIYPASTLKNVAVAHPNHTFKEIESSYVLMINKMPSEMSSQENLIEEKSSPILKVRLKVDEKNVATSSTCFIA